eukprot:30225-Pelagococcus_subviridis.AAC.2
MIGAWSRVARERTKLVFAVGRTGHTRGHHAARGGGGTPRERTHVSRSRACGARAGVGRRARAKFTASTAPYEYVGKNGVTFTLPSLVTTKSFTRLRTCLQSNTLYDSSFLSSGKTGNFSRKQLSFRKSITFVGKATSLYLSLHEPQVITIAGRD